jgi:asparagine synthase (glutamine-hydrolysing)
MCGIAGFIGEDRSKIERMIACLVHRGPDGNGVWTGSGASLGQARLAILDTSPAGNQPMWNDAKNIVITYNGEIYNYRRLRDSENFQCKTGTDTEVLLKLYEKYGIDFVTKLHGMFALGIYDTRTRTLHLARDTSGIKPLYITYVNNLPHFASEMRSLMSALPTKPALNMGAMSSFIRMQYLPGPATMCEGIESLQPGTTISWKDGKETRKAFRADIRKPFVVPGCKDSMPSHIVAGPGKYCIRMNDDIAPMLSAGFVGSADMSDRISDAKCGRLFTYVM